MLHIQNLVLIVECIVIFIECLLRLVKCALLAAELRKQQEQSVVLVIVYVVTCKEKAPKD